MDEKKVIIAGSRTFSNFDLLIDYCDEKLNEFYFDKVELVGGGAKGADYLGKEYAKLRGYKYREFSADWDKYGYAAGPIRNREMAEYADVLILFWDGKSRGSASMLREAMKRKIRVFEVLYHSVSDQKTEG